MLCSKLILNTSKINDKTEKIELEILFGLTHHSSKPYPQMLQKIFSSVDQQTFSKIPLTT